MNSDQQESCKKNTDNSIRPLTQMSQMLTFYHTYLIIPSFPQPFETKLQTWCPFTFNLQSGIS